MSDAKIFGLGGAKNVPGITQYTQEAILYAMAFGEGALLRIRYDKHYPDSIVVGDNQDFLFSEAMGMFRFLRKLPLLYIDEKVPVSEQDKCVDKIAKMLDDYGGVVLTPVPSVAERAIKKINHSHVMVGLLAGGLIKDGIDIVGQAQKIDGLSAIVLYGDEFTPERVRDIRAVNFYAMFNIKDNIEPKFIRAIAESGAWIICDDPRKAREAIAGI